MKKTIAIIGFFAILSSCTSTVEKQDVEVVKETETDSLSSIVKEEIVKVIVPEKGIELPVDFLKKFSRELKLPFNVSKRKLESLGEDFISDYFAKSSTEFSSEQIRILDSVWSNGPHSEKSRVKEGAFFASLSNGDYQKHLDTLSEWDTQYAKGFAYGSIQLKNDIKILVWQFRSGYGDGGTNGNFNAYFGSLVKNNRLLYSFDLGYFKEQADAPMYLTESFLSKIEENESFNMAYDTKTTEENFDTGETTTSREEHKKYQGLIVGDTLELKEIVKK
jgi:hypothetical protein